MHNLIEVDIEINVALEHIEEIYYRHDISMRLIYNKLLNLQWDIFEILRDIDR